MNAIKLLWIYISSRERLNISPPTFGHHTCDISDFLIKKNYSQLSENINNARKKHSLVGFIGGPPCPDFSVAGKNKGKEGENGKLSGIYIELICRSKPDFFLFENVKGLYRTAKHREFFDSLKAKLIKAGYYITERLINSIEYGAPQDRERIILIGFQRSVLGNLGFTMNGSPLIKNFNWEKNTLYKAENIFNMDWPGLEPFKQDNKKDCPSNVPNELTVEY